MKYLSSYTEHESFNEKYVWLRWISSLLWFNCWRIIIHFYRGLKKVVPAFPNQLKHFKVLPTSRSNRRLTSVVFAIHLLIQSREKSLTVAKICILHFTLALYPFSLSRFLCIVCSECTLLVPLSLQCTHTHTLSFHSLEAAAPPSPVRRSFERVPSVRAFSLN